MPPSDLHGGRMNPQALKLLLAFGRTRIAAAPHLEFRQAVSRLVIAASVLAYVALYVLTRTLITDAEHQGLLVTGAFFAFATVASAGIVFAPGAAKAWRIAGIVVDNAVT